MLHPTQYSNVLSKKMKESNSKVFLVNTGWNGKGNRISLNDTRHRVLLGPYADINTLQSAYNSINKLNFENIELIKND